MLIAKKNPRYQASPSLIIRPGLNFRLEEIKSVNWFDDDQVKTRFLEAHMAAFPEGEKFFIATVRNCLSELGKDIPQSLSDSAQKFIYQEAQHAIVHSRFNSKLESAGMPVSELVRFQKKVSNFALSRFHPSFNIACTSACEHMIVVIAESFFANQSVTKGIHRNMRALLIWHTVEESEHKSVVYDIMQNAAKTSYVTRILAMIVMSIFFLIVSFSLTNNFLKADGVSLIKRMPMFVRGFNWLFGFNGVITPFLWKYFSYYRPNFHPTDLPSSKDYNLWRVLFEDSKDPIIAGDKFYNNLAG